MYCIPFGSAVCSFVFLGVMFIHIGVGSNVVCSTLMGNARASMRGMDNDSSTLFYAFKNDVSDLRMFQMSPMLGYGDANNPL